MISFLFKREILRYDDQILFESLKVGDWKAGIALVHRRIPNRQYVFNFIRKKYFSLNIIYFST